MTTAPQYGISEYGVSQYGIGEIEESDFSINPLSHQINISNIVSAVGTLQKKNVFNQFDELGYLVSLIRINGETNWEYKRRILDVFSHISNSSYVGLINGITRELGLELYSPIIINPKKDNNGAFLAADPYIKIEEAYIYLYSDYSNSKLDYKIDRYMSGQNYEYLKNLVDFINTTNNFEAEIISPNYYYDRSMALLNQSNRVFIKQEALDTSTRYRLSNRHIIRGSVIFQNTQIHKKEVATEEQVIAPGDYFIDYKEGIIISKSIPPLEETITYEYIQYPFKIIASPVILNNLNSEDFKIKLYEQIIQENNNFFHGMTTELGTDIINELLSVCPMYWGK